MVMDAKESRALLSTSRKDGSTIQSRGKGLRARGTEV
jgi:hypothetical protein